jgi:nucleoside-diphosphate-sugar epimerase
MIIGSGLLAKAFTADFADARDVWIYAAGVSNSGCKDPAEFERERIRLTDALHSAATADAFVYFSTCSIGDPAAVHSHYVRHKIEMEALVGQHPGFVIARLPQIAGHTPNPHTLLNYLFARISRSESFVAWKNATRNVIDVADVYAAVARLIAAPARRITVNVANTRGHSVSEIVNALEAVVGKPAVVDWMDTGASYEIDVMDMMPIYRELALRFDETYLLRTIRKYYGS